MHGETEQCRQSKRVVRTQARGRLVDKGQGKLGFQGTGSGPAHSTQVEHGESKGVDETTAVYQISRSETRKTKKKLQDNTKKTLQGMKGVTG